jgi:PAS domain-containing protein
VILLVRTSIARASAKLRQTREPWHACGVNAADRLHVRTRGRTVPQSTLAITYLRPYSILTETLACPIPFIGLAGLDLGAEDFLAAMLRTATQRMWVADPEDVIRFANPAAVATLGHERADDLLGSIGTPRSTTASHGARTVNRS